MECEAAPKLPDLGLGYGVPSAQGLHGERQEGQTLPSAVLLSAPELAVVGEVEGVSRFNGLPVNCGVLQRARDSDIQGCVLTPCPMGEEDISRSPISSGEEETSLFDRAQACICSCEKDRIAQSVMARYPLRSHSAAKSVIPFHI